MYQNTLQSSGYTSISAFNVIILNSRLSWSLLAKAVHLIGKIHIFSSNLISCQSEDVEASHGILPGNISEKSKPRRQHPSAVEYEVSVYPAYLSQNSSNYFANNYLKLPPLT
ncbi:unnamed protein product [Clonostachys byssicola]|uniref:Uncharacterized protein n=1 Tax=Clonostachys byssicola TaxID=160290 RepID=A0A9N9U1R7_9HYPO|nr:unnamed protein product [Clonostachys byssicola]